jgi:hypothetical protein
MSDRKILTINPDIFSFGGRNNSTKKRQPKAPKAPKDAKIRIKTGRKDSSTPKKVNDTLKKKSILKMIRQHQEDRYKKLFDVNGNKSKTIIEDADTTNFNNDFKEAQTFFENLTEKKEKEKHSQNATIKHYPSPPMNSLLLNQSIDPFLQVETLPYVHIPELSTITNDLEEITDLFIQPSDDTFTSLDNVFTPLDTAFTPMPCVPLPKSMHGCLKNGNLPTYRRYMNSTCKNQPAIQITGGKSRQDVVEDKINDSLKRVGHMKQVANKLKDIKSEFKNKLKKSKRKKTIRRTFKVGKSKVFPRVSVLVSNKTIRNNATTKAQLLNQVPLQDIKKDLMKRGFLKIGSTAPNDVLRKMYEAVTMICGEIQNHNPDNLVYNFMNGGEHGV